MKRAIICAIFLSIFGFTGISQKDKIQVPQIEKNITISSFDQLTIDGIFKLTLVENDKPAIQVKGSPRFVKAFKIYQHQKALLITSHYADQSINNQVTINVKNLKKLIVRQESVINTRGVLQSENLNILLDAECLVKVINNGVIKIKSSENFEFETLK